MAADEVTPEQMKAYFSAKKIRPICERCGENSWSSSEGANASPALIFFDRDTWLLGDNRLISLISLTCNNCGNVWLIDREKVRRALGLKEGDGGKS